MKLIKTVTPTELETLKGALSASEREKIEYSVKSASIIVEIETTDSGIITKAQNNGFVEV